MKANIFFLAVVLGVATPGFGQSFNVDVGDPNSAAGVPSDGYAAASQPGVEIGFNLSGSGDALGGQFSVDDVLNASDLTIVIAWNSVLGEECPWDLDGGGDVGILDLLALLAAWGTDPGGPPDFNGDGDVGILDLLTLLANWGPCP